MKIRSFADLVTPFLTILAIFLLLCAPAYAYRDYYYDVILDTSGNPIPSAKVYIYLAGTTTPAKVYSSLTGTTSASSRITAADGTFFFYLDRFDYGTSQKFDFSVVKEGFYSAKRANVNVDSPVMGSYPITANKDITNYLYVPKGVTYAVAAGCTLSGLIDAGPYVIKTGDGILASSLLPNDRQWYGELNYTKFHIVEATEFVGESKMEWPLNSGLALYDETTGKWGPSVTDNSANWNNAVLDAFKWDGGASGLNAETGRASLGLGSAALADTSAFLPAAGISTPGYLIKWGDVPFEATDAIPLGTLLDGGYCTYSDLKGLECTSAGGGGGDMVYPLNTGLAYYNSATGTWGSSLDPSSFLPATGNAVSASALKDEITTGLLHVMGLSNGTVRTKVTRDADDHLLELGGSYTPTGTWIWTSAAATWPTFNQDTTGLTNANVPNPSAIYGAGAQTADKRAYVICSDACTVSLPVPVAGNQIIVRLSPGLAKPITLAGQAGVYYEKTDHSGYGTAGYKLVSGGVATDAIYLLGLDSTHYLVMNATGTWTDTP